MFSQPLKVTVGDKDRYSLPFFVDPGEYEVRLRFQGEVLHEDLIAVGEKARDRPVAA